MLQQLNLCALEPVATRESPRATEQRACMLQHMPSAAKIVFFFLRKMYSIHEMNVLIHNLNEVPSSESILIGFSKVFFKFTRTDEA